MNQQSNEAPAMKYDSLKLAAVIAKKCRDHGIYWNNTKIQKLLYCCYGCTLAKFDGRICDEYPRAWQYGPVFPRVFNYIRKGNDFREINDCGEITDNQLVDDLIEEVVKTFGVYTATSLSEWTHSKDSPWDKVVNQTSQEEGGGLNNFIPDDLIADYFKLHVVEL